METLQEYIAAGMGIAYHAQNYPEKKAIISEHGERTFQELNENSNKFANFLRKKGLKSGDAVAILSKNRPEFLEALFGPLRIGLRVTPINWHLTPDEVVYIVKNCEAKVLACDAMFAPSIEAVNRELSDVLVLAVDGTHDLAKSYQESLDGEDPDNIQDPEAGSAGHLFVLDGYDTNDQGDYFHINWGWGGSNNGYFYLTEMICSVDRDNSTQVDFRVIKKALHCSVIT